MKFLLLIVAALALATSNALPVNRPITVANDGTVSDAVNAQDLPVVIPEAISPVALREPVISEVESPSPIVLPEAVAPVVVAPETPTPVVLPETITPVVENPSPVVAPVAGARDAQASQPTIDVNDIHFVAAGSGDPTHIVSKIKNELKIDNTLAHTDTIDVDMSNGSTFMGNFLGLPKVQ